jgi:hypothetical protein
VRGSRPLPGDLGGERAVIVRRDTAVDGVAAAYLAEAKLE